MSDAPEMHENAAPAEMPAEPLPAEVPMMAEAPATPMLKMFVLKAADRNEPPFHFSNTAHTVFVAAEDAGRARVLAMLAFGSQWSETRMVASGEAGLTTCEELQLTEPGVIAYLSA